MQGSVSTFFRRIHAEIQQRKRKSQFPVSPLCPGDKSQHHRTEVLLCTSTPLTGDKYNSKNWGFREQNWGEIVSCQENNKNQSPSASRLCASSHCNISDSPSHQPNWECRQLLTKLHSLTARFEQASFPPHQQISSHNLYFYSFFFSFQFPSPVKSAATAVFIIMNIHKSHLLT